MEGSMLTCTVMEAKDLKAMDIGGTSDPYAILKLSQQQVETSYIKNTLNPVWDETYTFDVQGRDEVLRVVVMDRDAVGTDDFEGKVNIPLRTLTDQKKEDKWYILEAEQLGQPWQGQVTNYLNILQIRLQLQWIHSRVQYMTEYLRRWEIALKNHKSRIDAIENHLEKLRQPFGWMNTDTIRRFYDDKEDRLQYTQQVPHYGGATQQRFTQAERNLSQRMDPIAKNIAETFGNARSLTQRVGYRKFPWYQTVMWTIIIYYMLVLCVLFYRPDFVNVCNIPLCLILRS